MCADVLSYHGYLARASVMAGDGQQSHSDRVRDGRQADGRANVRLWSEGGSRESGRGTSKGNGERCGQECIVSW